MTGNPIVGTAHAVQSIDNGKHIIMVNVEADCMVGPLLQRRAEAAGVVYSMAYGDQPALICEMVDWCRTVGFDIVAAGKGTKYLPEYNYSTPDTVWNYYGFSDEQLASGDFNPKMFNSFLDGTKSAIEMAAVANGTGLTPQDEGLFFPPAGVDDLPNVYREKSVGGILTRRGTVEIASSLNRDGTEVERDLRWGVYVTFEAKTDYAAQCFAEYGVKTDATGRYGSLYRPYHMIGLELGVSIASAVLRGRSHRLAHRLPRRRHDDGEEGPQGRRNPGRRRRLHRVRQAGSGPDLAGTQRPAAGPGARHETQARRPQGRHRLLGRRRRRRNPLGGPDPAAAGDGIPGRDADARIGQTFRPRTTMEMPPAVGRRHGNQRGGRT